MADNTFLDRLLKEHSELTERLEKLRTFQTSDKFQTIDSFQMTLLNIQECAMATYSQCLLERIVWLQKNQGDTA